MNLFFNEINEFVLDFFVKKCVYPYEYMDE